MRRNSGSTPKVKFESSSKVTEAMRLVAACHDVMYQKPPKPTMPIANAIGMRRAIMENRAIKPKSPTNSGVIVSPLFNAVAAARFFLVACQPPEGLPCQHQRYRCAPHNGNPSERYDVDLKNIGQFPGPGQPTRQQENRPCDTAPENRGNQPHDDHQRPSDCGWKPVMNKPHIHMGPVNGRHEDRHGDRDDGEGFGNFIAALERAPKPPVDHRATNNEHQPDQRERADDLAHEIDPP